MRTAFLILLSATLAVAQVKLPPYSHEVLPNGVVVDLMPKPGLPLVEVQVVIKGGMESEPSGFAGIASTAVSMLRKGTPTRSAQQFSEQLDGLGGTWGESTDGQSARVTASFLSKDFDAGFALVADAVLHPAFPDAEVRKALPRLADQLRSAKDQPQIAVELYSEAFFFGPAHAYGRIQNEASLGRLDRDNIVAYYRKMYTGANTIVIVAGEFDAAKVNAAIAKTFGSMPRGLAFPASPEPALEISANRLLLVDKPDATQTYFTIARPGIDRTSPDRFALMLVNTLFGGRFTSMLNDELRVNSGLTYGARSSYTQDRLAGRVVISTYTKTDTTFQAVDLALDVLKKLHKTGLTAEQLASAKAYVKGTFPTRHLETSGQLASELADIEVFGLNRGDVDDLFSALDSVTVEQANQVIRKYWQPDNLTFVLVGNASKIRSGVGKYAGSVREVSVTKPGFGE